MSNDSIEEAKKIFDEAQHGEENSHAGDVDEDDEWSGNSNLESPASVSSPMDRQQLINHLIAQSINNKLPIEGAPFVVKTYQLLNDPNSAQFIAWSESKDGFVVQNPVDFASQILPKYFKHNNFCSFIRQLNTYGFHKVESKQWEFRHDSFQQGRPELLKNILRRKSRKREADNSGASSQENKKVESTNSASAPSTPQVAHQNPQSAMPMTSHTPAPSAIPQSINGASNQSPIVQAKNDSTAELQVLRMMNEKLIQEVTRLNQQQEGTQSAIKSILEELILSRREQQDLHLKVHELSNTVQEQQSKQMSETNRSLLQSLQSLQSQRQVQMQTLPSCNPTQMALSSQYFTEANDQSISQTNLGGTSVTQQINNNDASLESLLVGSAASLLSIDTLSLQQVDLNSPGGTNVTDNCIGEAQNTFPYVATTL